MKKPLLYTAVALLFFSCKKDKDRRTPFTGTWVVQSVHEKTPVSDTLLTNAGFFTMEKDPGETGTVSMLNPLVMDKNAADRLRPFSEMRQTGCLENLGNQTYRCYWYLDDDDRLYLNGISNALTNHVEVCTYTLEDNRLTLVFAQGDYAGTGYAVKQTIVLQKQ